MASLLIPPAAIVRDWVQAQPKLHAIPGKIIHPTSDLAFRDLRESYAVKGHPPAVPERTSCANDVDVCPIARDDIFGARNEGSGGNLFRPRFVKHATRVDV